MQVSHFRWYTQFVFTSYLFCGDSLPMFSFKFYLLVEMDSNYYIHDIGYRVTKSCRLSTSDGTMVILSSALTLHPAPTAQVSNVTVERVNSNRAALVSWTPLTLHQARGFPVYFVTYQPSSQDERVVRAVNTVSTTDSRVQIDDLDPTAEYLIAVDVGTAGGQLRSTLGAGA